MPWYFTPGQCHQSMSRVQHKWHWPTSQCHLCCTREIDRQSMSHMQHPWHWPPVNVTYAAPVRLTTSQCHICCTREIDYQSMSHMQHPWDWPNAFVTLTGCNLHSSSVCTNDIDYSAPVTLTISLKGTHKTCVDTPYWAPVTLTNMHPWHWLSVIYTQYLFAPLTLTICTHAIDI